MSYEALVFINFPVDIILCIKEIYYCSQFVKLFKQTD
jgi:hypothetical protein